MPSAWLLLVAVSNAVCREQPLQICALLSHTLISSMILSLVVPREQSFEFWMFNRRGVLACLFSYVSSWLQFDGIKPSCRLASQLVCSLFQHTAPCSLPASLGSTRVGKKGKVKKIPGIFIFKKLSPLQLPAFPIIKSPCLFATQCRQKPGITEDCAITTQSEIWK